MSHKGWTDFWCCFSTCFQRIRFYCCEVSMATSSSELRPSTQCTRHPAVITAMASAPASATRAVSSASSSWPGRIDGKKEKWRDFEEILKRIKKKWKVLQKKRVQQRCRPPAAASASALSAAALALRASEHRAQWSNSLGLSTFNSLTMFNS